MLNRFPLAMRAINIWRTTKGTLAFHVAVITAKRGSFGLRAPSRPAPNCTKASWPIAEPAAARSLLRIDVEQSVRNSAAFGQSPKDDG